MEAGIDKFAATDQNGLPDDEQCFAEWLPKRLSLYQSLDQQVQTGISQTLQFASDFARQMDDEAERLLARYRQARLEQQQARDSLLREHSELRAALAELRRHHEVEIAQARRQAETEIAQARRQAETEIAQQQARASAERERVLREAYAERERILADSRTLAARLAGLQRSLSDILQPADVSEPAEEVALALRTLPPSELLLQDSPPAPSCH